MTLILFASSFPYPPGEQFIETEIKYFSETTFDKKIIFPHSTKGVPRCVPSNIEVHNYLNKIGKYKFLFKGLFNRFFYEEIKYLFRSRKLNISTAKSALIAIAHVLRSYSGIKKWCQSNGVVDVAYVYWNSTTAYAACYAKKAGLIKKVISRAHGYDLYEERQPNQYMPLKRQFVVYFDKVNALSNEGKKYLQVKYGFDEKYIEVSPLGVHVPFLVSNPSADGNIKIVSVSFCVPVKRIDKIINSIALFSSENPALNISWTHIGGGPLLDYLKDYAMQKFMVDSKINWEFLGHRDNLFVLKYYQENEVDLFINLSESEGVPVSIMESMAAGIPSIATNVGGVSTLVNMENGYLLCANPTEREVSEAIGLIIPHLKRNEMRHNARTKVCVEYNAEINYSKFYKKLELIVR